MIFEKEAFGSLLQIDTFQQNIPNDRIKLCFDTVSLFEQNYSRFIPDNYLNKFNRNWWGKLTDEFKYLIKLAQKVWEDTNGYFDITLLPVLENNGYGIEKENLKVITWMNFIYLDENLCKLHHWVQIDLGGIGKWYMIDVLFWLLDEYLDTFIINFGGDIRVKWSHIIWLEDPFDTTKIIGEVSIENISLCGSSGQKRKIKNGHHIINPKTKQSQSDKIAVFCSHEKTIYSDTYATALFAAPLDESIKILNKSPWLEALIIASNGNIFKSHGFKASLY